MGFVQVSVAKGLFMDEDRRPTRGLSSLPYSLLT